MRKMLFGFTCLLVVLFMNCSSLTVKTDYDPEYNFEEFKTYRWATVDELNPDDVLSDWPMVYKQVQTSVDKQLEKKGLTKMASGDSSSTRFASRSATARRFLRPASIVRGWGSP